MLPCLVPSWPQSMQLRISFRSRSDLVLDADHALDECFCLVRLKMLRLICWRGHACRGVWGKFLVKCYLKFEILDGKNLVKLGGRKALKMMSFGGDFRSASENISATSFQISRLLSETPFSRRVMLTTWECAEEGMAKRSFGEAVVQTHENGLRQVSTISKACPRVFHSLRAN